MNFRVLFKIPGQGCPCNLFHGQIGECFTIHLEPAKVVGKEENSVRFQKSDRFSDQFHVITLYVEGVAFPFIGSERQVGARFIANV